MNFSHHDPRKTSKRFLVFNINTFCSYRLVNDNHWLNFFFNNWIGLNYRLLTRETFYINYEKFQYTQLYYFVPFESCEIWNFHAVGILIFKCSATIIIFSVNFRNSSRKIDNYICRKNFLRIKPFVILKVRQNKNNKCLQNSSMPIIRNKFWRNLQRWNLMLTLVIL